MPLVLHWLERRGVIFGVYYTQIDPLMGIMPGIKAFVAAVLGGIGIIPGAMVGGIVLGVVETLVSAFGLLDYGETQQHLSF